MKPALLIALFLVATSQLIAQTKEIAFKSHSGSKADFEVAMKEDLFNPENTDFGMVAIETVKNAQLDSVIYISDSTAIMITSEYCTMSRRGSRDVVGQGILWQAGKQLVYNHPLFSRQHSLDSIKNILQSQYHFRNPVERVVFIGYDNKKDSCNSYDQTMIPPTTGGDHTPFDLSFIFILSCIIGCSLIGGWLSWRYGGGAKQANEKFLLLRR